MRMHDEDEITIQEEEKREDEQEYLQAIREERMADIERMSD